MNCNNNLIAEKADNETLFFYYDFENSPVALSYNGKMFYYVKNLQGDLLYFDGNGDGIYTHASIISSIIKDKKNSKKNKGKRNSIVCILQMK